MFNGRFVEQDVRLFRGHHELSGGRERRWSAHALRFAIMGRSHLSQRLELLLCHRADRFGRVETDRVLLPVALSHELLARLVGAGRPSVSGRFKELEHAEVHRAPSRWCLGCSPVSRPRGANLISLAS